MVGSVWSDREAYQRPNGLAVITKVFQYIVGVTVVCREKKRNSDNLSLAVKS